MGLIESLAKEVNSRFTNWAFRGSIVDWYYFNGQVIVKDFDIVTSDPFEPTTVCSYYGPRMSWNFLGRAIDVFHEPEPGPRMQTIEGRIERLRLISETYPHRRDKSLAMIERYLKLQSAGPQVFQSVPHLIQPQTSLIQVAKPAPSPVVEQKVCQYRGPQFETIICDQCGQGKGQEKPVYACAIHGRCTHRLERRGQETQEIPVKVCIGCPDGPWPA